MFYRQASNQYINEGQAFTVDGTQYPSNWLNLSTPEEKEALGLAEVVASGTPFNPRYYWASEVLEGAVLTYSGTPKDLDEVKKTEVAQVKQAAFAILQPSDYIDVRNLRDPSYKPEWILWRDSVRAVASATVAAIQAASDIEEVIAAVEAVAWPNNPNQ